MDIEVTSSVMEAIRAAAVRALPNEACGILLGEDRRITQFTQTANVHPTPQSHFEIDPKSLIETHKSARQGGAQVLGYFHSHPTGDPKPSNTDAAMAAGGGAIWAIIGGETIGWWRDGPDGFTPLSYSVITA